MEKIQKQCLLLAVVLGVSLNIYASDPEVYIFYRHKHTPPTVSRSLDAKPELQGQQSLSEFGLSSSRCSKPQCGKKPTQLMAIVPDVEVLSDNDKDNGDDEIFFLDDSVITPSQKLAGSLNAFIFLEPTTADEIIKNPKQVQMLLQAASKKIVDLEKLLASSKQNISREELAASPKKRRSFGSLGFDSDSIVIQSDLRQCSVSFELKSTA